jgi:uncharacterized membrane protein YraQ (UPF0718 family)
VISPIAFTTLYAVLADVPAHMFVLACLASLALGFILGVAAEWQLIKPWVNLALLQSAVLHGPLKRTGFAAGPDDAAERDRLAHRHQT